jgi:Ca2+/Na+ antiporter
MNLFLRWLLLPFLLLLTVTALALFAELLEISSAFSMSIFCSKIR